MRSKTTVRGPSLSASAVIALGGKRGLRGRRLEKHSRVFVYVRWDFVWRCATQAPGPSTPRLACSQSKYWWLRFLPLSGPTRLAGKTQVCSLFGAALLRVTQAGRLPYTAQPFCCSSLLLPGEGGGQVTWNHSLIKIATTSEVTTCLYEFIFLSKRKQNKGNTFKA